MDLRRDLIAGITLAALAIPEQLATAKLASLPAVQGVLVFAAASIVALFFARNRNLSLGADSTIAPVIAAALAGAAAAPGEAALIALMAGVMLCLVAILRMEWLARLMSRPVAAGMLAGIALHILIGRLPTALGLNEAASSVTQTLHMVWMRLDQAQLAPLLMTMGVAAICLAARAINHRLPGPLIALVLAAGLAATLDPNASIWIRVGSEINTWGLTLPTLSLSALLETLPAALTIAFLCLFQTSLVLRDEVDDGPSLRRNALATVGLANLAAAGIGGFAVNTSPARSALLRDSDVASQWAGLIAAAIGLAILVFAPGVLGWLPAAALAGILVFIALHLFPLHTLIQLSHRSHPEAIIAAATAAFVTLLPLQLGLPLAMLLSIIHASLPVFAAHAVPFHPISGTTIWASAAPPEKQADKEILVLGLTAPLNFANAEEVITDIRAALSPDTRLLILECAEMLSIDTTAADALAALHDEINARGVTLALARVESVRAQQQLERTGLLQLLGPQHIFNSVDQAVRALS